MGVTTGDLFGRVTDDDGEVLPGATVSAFCNAIGASYQGSTDSLGRYRFLHVDAGDPYSIVATMVGFKAQKKEGLIVKPGEDLVVNFQLQVSSM